MTDNNIKMVLNQELNGVELYFTDKPAQEVLNTLKQSGFRWSGKKFCWYAKQKPETLKLAKQLTAETTNTTEQTTTDNSTKTTTQTKEPYFPPYIRVNGTEIYKTSETELTSRVSGYYADINAYIHSYENSILLIDLTNALKTGKTCDRYSIRLEGYDNKKSVITELWNVGKIETVKAFYDAVIAGLNIDTLHVDKGSEKGINTFSPFVEVKPITTPKKWTIAHVWKAILSGQIYKGVQDGHYTDDYAYDYANNYGTGSKRHLISFAEKLIEHSSGWWVSVDKEENGKIQLSVNCHTFDCNTLYYDEKCNLIEAEQRRTKEAEELENYNNSMLAQVQNLSIDDVEPNALYKITYLDMDQNTKKYNKKHELLTGSELFWEDEVYTEEGTEIVKYTCNRKVTAMEKQNIIADRLYTISNFYNRPYFEDDNRYINMGNWETIITGKALAEVLQEGHKYPMIQESGEYKTFEQAITYIQNHITGKMMWCSGVCDTDYKESFKRIMKEMNRVNINSTAM